MDTLPELPNYTIRHVNRLNYSSSEESFAFIKHFAMANAFEPFNLVKEITYRVDYPGNSNIVAYFPFGLNAFLKEKHAKGIIEMTNSLFAQFYGSILLHLKKHPSLDTLTSMRLLLKDSDEEVIYAIKTPNGSVVKLLTDGLHYI